MKVINLNDLDEPVRNLFLALANELAGSVLTCEGRPIAWVVPDSAANEKADEPWTEAKDQRRCELLERMSAGGLPWVEAVELAQLQAAMLRVSEVAEREE